MKRASRGRAGSDGIHRRTARVRDRRASVREPVSLDLRRVVPQPDV